MGLRIFQRYLEMLDSGLSPEVRLVEFMCGVRWHLSQDLGTVVSFRTSPNSMEFTMCSGLSRPPVRPVSEYEFCVGEIPALQQVGLNEDDIRRAQKMDIVATLQSLRLFANELSRMRIPLC